MTTLYDVPAPAKLNIFLHIVGRRPDGYHLLQSVFMLIDWSDSLHFSLRRDGMLTREDLGPALPADDLTLRAARLLQQYSGCPLGAHIGVDKRVPAQAGMGGGSSDAASCLLALNRLWQLKLPLDTLARLGLQLGADVPFFVRGRNAWVEGIGEQISALEGEHRLPPGRFLVVKPAAGLDTGKIFSSPTLKRDTIRATITGFAAASKFSFGCNDMQAVAEQLCPEMVQVLGWMQAQGLEGRMTGSGSAVFAPLAPQTEVTAMAGASEAWQSRVCSNLDVHPLWGWASSDSQ